MSTVIRPLCRFFLILAVALLCAHVSIHAQSSTATVSGLVTDSAGAIVPNAIHEDINLVFRAEAFNVFNRVQFGDPGLTLNTATFGVPTSRANNPRSFQFSLRANY